MKILLLNPCIDAQHKVVIRLQAAGAVVIYCANADEASKMIQFHGGSLDLAVIHREGLNEGEGDPGTRLIKRIKREPSQSDLPMILTSSQWSEAEFFEHQQGAEGVNAYLRWPFTEEQLIDTIETMFGNSIRFAGSTGTEGSTAGKQTGSLDLSKLRALSGGVADPSKGFAGMSVVLEEASQSSEIVNPEAGTLTSGLELKLDAPAEGVGIPGTAATLPTEALTLGKSASNPDATGSFVIPSALETEVKFELTSGASPALSVGQPQDSIGQTGTIAPDPATSDDVSRMLTANLRFQTEAPRTATATATVGMGTSPVIVEPAPITDTGSLDISSLMNEDLEPHERLEIEQKKKKKAQEIAKAEARYLAERAEADREEQEAAARAEPVVTGIGADSLVIEGVPSPEPGEEPAVVFSRGRLAQDEPEIPSDDDFISDLPYLFHKPKQTGGKPRASSALVFAEPVGDAVVPGGASQSPDIETLKKYLLLREQDVAVLSNQLKSAREQIIEFERLLKEEKGHSSELTHRVNEQGRRIDEFEKEKALALQGLQSEIDELRFQNRTKSDKARVLETHVREATDEIERLKERVRTDIRKIRVREKELENKLEIVRKDSEALITAREGKIMELKRKLDLLEFNMDLLQDQNAKEKENSSQLRERLSKAAQVVRVAGGLLDQPGRDGVERNPEHKEGPERQDRDEGRAAYPPAIKKPA